MGGGECRVCVAMKSRADVARKGDVRQVAGEKMIPRSVKGNPSHGKNVGIGEAVFVSWMDKGAMIMPRRCIPVLLFMIHDKRTEFIYEH